MLDITIFEGLCLPKMENQDFHELANRLRNGDTSVLKMLFSEHAQYCINGLIKKHSCSDEEAKDIYVDAVLNLRDKLIDRKIDSIKDIRGYLYATCKNMFLAELKRKERIGKAVFETLKVQPETEETQQKELLLQTVENSLAILGEKCRDILTAFYFTKLSLEEIATKFEMAGANVAKVTKSRCLQRLIESVKSDYQKTELKVR